MLRRGRVLLRSVLRALPQLPAPILGIAGNHDGVTYPKEAVPTLDAYLRNFCSATPVHTDESAGLSRTATIQPGVYYTLEAPFVRPLGLYSNTLEDPGVISTEGGVRTTLNDDQLTYLQTALARCKTTTFPVRLWWLCTIRRSPEA